MVWSATASFSPSGVFATTMPNWVAALTGTLSVPLPVRMMAPQFGRMESSSGLICPFRHRLEPNTQTTSASPAHSARSWRFSHSCTTKSMFLSANPEITESGTIWLSKPTKLTLKGVFILLSLAYSALATFKNVSLAFVRRSLLVPFSSISQAHYLERAPSDRSSNSRRGVRNSVWRECAIRDLDSTDPDWNDSTLLDLYKR